ncbi:hypothetical protein [Glycomyces paridis]|uniref:Uncharacterized protein n=1 Tax=Glycomyces paridis TaxID=2126555 RepID=A0A4S8PGH8_9ACTN|nr:hypothetical protein [Glycomyces paridis]THV29021.1 hypothetical protein E9998_09740 [Glycomyces paridis]
MRITRPFPKWHIVIGAVVLAATTGCAADAEPIESVSPVPTSSEAASPTPEEPTTEETESPQAIDAESCGDGECDVAFTGSAEYPLGDSEAQWMVIAVVGDDGVDVDLTNPEGLGGGGGLLAEAGCTLTFRADGGGGNACGNAEPPAPEPGGIVVHLVELNGNEAVLHAALG